MSSPERYPNRIEGRAVNIVQAAASRALYPAVLEHAAALLGHSAWEVSRDARLLAAAHLRAYEEYRQVPVSVGIDVYHTEVEAWGVEVREGASGQPVLGAPLCADTAAILQLRPLDLHADGRLPVLLEAAARVAVACPEAEPRVPLAGPFSVAVGLLGFEAVLLELAEEGGAALRPALEFLAAHQARLCRQLLARGLQPVIYESGAAPPLVSPEAFHQLLAPVLRTVLNTGREVNRPIACILGGDVATVAEVLFQSGPGAVICPAETDQGKFMETARDFPEIAVRINLPARVWAQSDLAAVESAIRARLPFLRGHPRARLGTGVVPFDADPAFIRAAQQVAVELLGR